MKKAPRPREGMGLVIECARSLAPREVLLATATKKQQESKAAK